MARTSKMKAVYAMINAARTCVSINRKGQIVAHRVERQHTGESDQSGYITIPATKELLAACDKAADLASVKCQITPEGIADLLISVPVDPLGANMPRVKIYVDAKYIGTARRARILTESVHPAMRYETVVTNAAGDKVIALAYFEAA